MHFLLGATEMTEVLGKSQVQIFLCIGKIIRLSPSLMYLYFHI